MQPLRDLLLRASESRFLAERLPRLGPVRRAVRRFIPGERLEDALGAVEELADRGIASVLTHLGENVTDRAEAEATARGYVRALERVEELGHDAEVSVKPTHLGLDLGRDLARRNLVTVARQADEVGRFTWVDMERRRYVDDTLDLVEAARSRTPRVGVCLQAYLRRTRADLERMLAAAVGVRLVKGAYREPPEAAYQADEAVDRNFLELAERLLRSTREDGVRHAFATHDAALLERVEERAVRLGLSRDAYEVQMLYGIRPRLQRRLAGEGFRVRVLISYGAEWFSWYVRRLAERPANLLHLLRNLGPTPDG